jgi:hypothetical protein
MSRALREIIFDQIRCELFDKPVMSNLIRPHYVERMILFFLGRGWGHVGADWAGWDLQNRNRVRIEIKQSASRQTWAGRRKANGERLGPTKPIFDIREHASYFADGGRRHVKSQGRPADLYVFAWHGKYKPKKEVDHREPEQWTFYVLPASRLPIGQKSISLTKLKRLRPKRAACREIAKIVKQEILTLPTLKAVLESRRRQQTGKRVPDGTRRLS